MISDKSLTSNLITDRKRRYQHRKVNTDASSSTESLSSENSSNLRESSASEFNSNIGEIIVNSGGREATSTIPPRVDLERSSSSQDDLSSYGDDSDIESEEITNDYSSETVRAPPSENNLEEENTEPPLTTTLTKKTFKIPKINLQQQTVRSEPFDSTSFITDRLTEGSRNDDHQKTSRVSRGNSLEFRKRLNSLLKKENKTDMYMTNMQELIENSQNKLGEEVTTSDKDYEIMKIINRGTDRLIHKISLDDGDNTSDIKSLENEYSTDEVYIFRDIGAEFKVFCPSIFQHLR